MSRMTREITAQRKGQIMQVKNPVVNCMGGISYQWNPVDTLKMITASSIFGEPAYYRNGEFEDASVTKVIDGVEKTGRVRGTLGRFIFNQRIPQDLGYVDRTDPAKLLDLDANGIYNAISLAAIQSSGLMLITESGQACKPINPANAARSGILAAQLAQKGIESSVYPLESPKGWFHAMSDSVDEAEVTDGLGERFTICESYLKPHPSCRHTHSAIEAALKIRERLLDQFGQIDPQKVERIAVYIYPNAIRVAGNIQMPKTDEDSKFSIHYALAVALWRGHFDLSDLNIDHMEPEIGDIISKIVIVPDESMENKKAGIRGAKICLSYADGSRYEECVNIPKGDADNPFTMRELWEKLAACAEGVITAQQQRSLLAAVDAFEKLEKYNSINTLFIELKGNK